MCERLCLGGRCWTGVCVCLRVSECVLLSALPCSSYSISPCHLRIYGKSQGGGGGRGGDLRIGSLCPQSGSGDRGGNVSQALRASPERKASICLSEGKWLFVHVWKDLGAGLALSHHCLLGPAQSRGGGCDRDHVGCAPPGRTLVVSLVGGGLQPEEAEGQERRRG